jgi:penicillin-binding protein 2
MKILSRPRIVRTCTLVLGTLLLASLTQSAFAKSRNKKSSGKSVAKASKPTNKKSVSRVEAKVTTKEVQSLLRKKGKLTKEERKKVSSYRASIAAAERRRRQAIIEARLRAIRARDEGLRNIAVTNVLKDNSTGEDLEIRRAATEALGGRAGTVVVMDPNNGRILTVVNQQMALGTPVKPCSTVKLISGLAALHDGVFDPNLDVPITARYSLNLTDALARSDNPFFQVLGQRVGFENLMRYASNFGFGEMTGVNYPGENPGFLPEEPTKLMPSHGDGFGVTAIQLSAFAAAIANGGNLYVPRVPRSLEEQSNFRPQLKRRIEMTPEDRLRMMAGMTGAVNFGTAKLAYDPLSQVAGKTGTCTGDTDKLGLFTSFSSVDNPRIVVTVITTGSTEAGKRAAEIAGRVYRSISYRFFRPGTPMLTPASAVTEFPRLGGGSSSTASSNQNNQR